MRATEATEEELLNWIAAIQAAAEILDDNHELSGADRHAFLTLIQTETTRLQAPVRQIASLFPDCLHLGSATNAAAHRPAPSTSSVQTLKLFRVLGPNVLLIATSAASRPRAISTRPIRGTLLRASKVYQRPPR